MPDPPPGEYQVRVTGTGSGEYTLAFSYFDSQTSKTSDLVGFVLPGSENLYHLVYDPATPDVISISRIVNLDIKPGSDPNSINCKNENAVIAVAILTTESFDATSVDHRTVSFEGAHEIHVESKTGELKRHEEDVDGDGDIDLVLHFALKETLLTCDSTQGRLEGRTFNGVSIEGEDAIRMVH